MGSKSLLCGSLVYKFVSQKHGQTVIYTKATIEAVWCICQNPNVFTTKMYTPNFPKRSKFSGDTCFHRLLLSPPRTALRRVDAGLGPRRRPVQDQAHTKHAAAPPPWTPWARVMPFRVYLIQFMQMCVRPINLREFV